MVQSINIGVKMFVLKEIQICLGKDYRYLEYLFREVNVSEEPLFTNN